jgi:NADPH:quinone reductase-like Zn-dependent oxidoreductase
MQAVVYERYGPPEVLAFQEVAIPTPRDHEVLIKIHATTVSAGDWRARSLKMPAGFGPMGRFVLGVTRPRQPILGSELAGDVVATGQAVRSFRVGDRVIGYTGIRKGCHAEYICLPEAGMLARKPANLTYAEAAPLSDGGTVALDFFRRGHLQRGEHVLVNGASGGVGTAAVQLARYFGAEVTGVCSTANVELVRSLGATAVIDYTSEDFTENGERYDVIVDTAGTAPFSRSRGALTARGRLLAVLGGLPDLLRAPWVAMTSRQRIIAGPATPRAADVRLLAELAATGNYRAVIDRRYPFAQIVEAHRYVDAGHKKGNVVITLEQDA